MLKCQLSNLREEDLDPYLQSWVRVRVYSNDSNGIVRWAAGRLTGWYYHAIQHEFLLAFDGFVLDKLHRGWSVEVELVNEEH